MHSTHHHHAPPLSHAAARGKPLLALPPHARSANLDINGDGEISEEELRERLSSYTYRDELVSKIFASIDVDASGDISVEELRDAFVSYPTLRTAPGLGGLLRAK